MGNPVVHFEVIGKDGDGLRRYYGELFGWEFDTQNSMNYGIVAAAANPAPEGLGSIGGGVADGPEGYEGHVTFYVAVPDTEEALVKAESLGGTRVMGPETIMDMIELGQFKDPEGHLIGLVQSAG